MFTKKKILSYVLCFIMLLGMVPTSVSAYYEEPSAEGNTGLESKDYDYSVPAGVTMERFESDSISESENLGDDFLFVIKNGDRYYAMKDVPDSENDYSSIPAVDITEWVNEDGTITIPEDTQGVAFWRYEERDSYEYGMFINGTNKALEYNEHYEPVDGDDDYHNDADREYSGSFDVEVWNEDEYIDCLYFYTNNSVSGTLRFVGWWNEYYTSYNSRRHEYNVIVDVRNDGIGGKEFYFRYLGTDVKYTGDEVCGYLYYTECRHQYTIRHAEYDAPTCMLKGCSEYWYCEGCNQYYADEAMTNLFGTSMPVIPATGHDWGSDKCNNCNRPVPVYSIVTTQAAFNALEDDTMFILVAEYNGKYYTPDLAETYLYMVDSDGDGYFDICDVDKNDNNVPDLFEIDEDNSGTYDYLENDYSGDGIVNEEDWLLYQEMLCSAYVSDRLYNASSIPAKEIKISADGTFSHENAQDALEFEMIDLYLESEIDSMIEDVKQHEAWWTDDMRYTYECVKQFVVPNMFISSPSLLPMERQYQQRIADHGDTYSWGVLFYNNADDYKIYNYETETIEKPRLHDVCTPDSSVVFSTFDHIWYDITWERQLGQLRLRDYDGQIGFVTGHDYELEGSEYVYDEVSGTDYYDTHDTQASIYLYASQQVGGPVHTCEFGPWVEDENGRSHTRSCECGKTETETHGWDDGVQNGTPTCTEGAEITYTCSDCNATKTEEVAELGHDWNDWVDDGVNADTDTHSRTCKRNCGVAAESENHDWSDWTPDGDVNHKKTCSVCGGSRTDSHKWDDGVVINWSTHLAPGEIHYTCIDCGYVKIGTQPPLKEHEWSDWNDNKDGTHIRSCICNEVQTEPHSWSDWGLQDNGSYRRICETCHSTEYMTFKEEEPVNTTPVTNTLCADLINTDIELIDTILTDVEQSKAAAGSEVEIYLLVEDISNEVAPTEIEMVEAAAAGNQIGMYLDIDLFKKLDSEETQVTETNGKVKITIIIPDDLINESAARTRTYKIVCIHDGVTEVIEGVFNPEDNTFTFETDKFSTYAIIYNDVTNNKFTDVSESEYYYNPVLWAFGNNITTGTSATKFSPDNECTRAQIVTFLWRAMGSPEPTSTKNPFSDVNVTEYYGKAVLWAVENGITNGTSADKFSPDKECTRGQIVTFLWRAMDEQKPESKDNPFKDVDLDMYYGNAVLWAVENGITTGTSAGKFEPDKTCTRGQVVTFLYRAVG